MIMKALGLKLSLHQSILRVYHSNKGLGILTHLELDQCLNLQRRFLGCFTMKRQIQAQIYQIDRQFLDIYHSSKSGFHHVVWKSNDREKSFLNKNQKWINLLIARSKLYSKCEISRSSKTREQACIAFFFLSFF